jgi:hypothetical protein
MAVSAFDEILVTEGAPGQMVSQSGVVRSRATTLNPDRTDAESSPRGPGPASPKRDHPESVFAANICAKKSRLVFRIKDRPEASFLCKRELKLGAKHAYLTFEKYPFK